MYLLRQNYSYIFLVFVVLASFLCEDANASMLSRKHYSSEEDSSDDSSGSREWKDKWDKKDKNKKITFQCPKPNGVFPNAEDCSQYYKCKNGKPDIKKCNSRMHFDKLRFGCLPKFIAVCLEEQTTTKRRTTSKRKSTTPSNWRSSTPTIFVCPEEKGKFSHPEDCSKYYKCRSFLSTLETCSKGKFFDGIRKKCKDANEVHCGSRGKPTTSKPSRKTTLKRKRSTIGYRTTTAKPSTTTTEEPATHTVEPTTTTTTVEPTMTSTVELTTAMTTAESTMTTTFESTMTTNANPSEEFTTEEEPTGPPETDCNEDDLDCIIRETGEMPTWFKCPAALGSFPHPSSKKLFIICIRNKPRVKRCTENLVYSEEMKTCV